MTSNYALSVVDLFKSYNDKLVIDGANLSLAKGKIHCLVGLNGQGKTSLIKCVLDLCSFDSGNINIFGKLSSNHESRSLVSYLPEKFSPSPDIKGIEFLKFSLSLNSKKIDLHNLDDLCNMFSLDQEALNRKVSTYSKGMVQKLGLISTFLVDAELVILDEPMSGLDVQSRRGLKSLMTQSSVSRKRTIFFTSHILSDVEEICDEVSILHKCKIRYSGSVRGFYTSGKDDNMEECFLNIIKEFR